MFAVQSSSINQIRVFGQQEGVCVCVCLCSCLCMSSFVCVWGHGNARAMTEQENK